MKDVQPIESYTPQQAADMLHVTPSTLRKYCGLVTKYHGKEYFQRDASNARIFTRHDVDLLNRIVELKKAPNVTLDNAVLIALNQEASTQPVTLVTAADTSDKAALPTDIATIQHAIIQQNNQIQQLLTINQQLIQSNEQLSQNVQDLLQELKDSNTKTAAAVQAKPSLFGNWFKRP